MAKNRHLDELMQRVDEVLYYLWDPIGVNHVPEARNEYSSYVGRVCSALVKEQSPKQLAGILDGIITDAMGMGSQMEHCQEVAELLLELKVKLKEK